MFLHAALLTATRLQTVNPLVLVVEDEPDIADLLEAYLRREQFRTERASDGSSAVQLHRAARPDLVLLDVNLPEFDGFEVLRRIRETAPTPVIMVTALAQDLDKLLGLKLGADDYVVKPFSPLEVVARVKAVLRRVNTQTWTQPLRFANLELDPVAVRVRVAGNRLDVTMTEYRMLEHLMRHPNRAFTRAELLEVALPDSDALERVIDTHLGNLRKKLEGAGLPNLIQTVRGLGFRFCLE
ncbi:MAG: response regulator transcription factor [Pleurocapsa sp. SU_196_0]|nr:response regulator transcription factor [Pleurocapsa sp. SU_196_0]